jgi:hypothetical protein
MMAQIFPFVWHETTIFKWPDYSTTKYSHFCKCMTYDSRLLRLILDNETILTKLASLK